MASGRPTREGWQRMGIARAARPRNSCLNVRFLKKCLKVRASDVGKQGPTQLTNDGGLRRVSYGWVPSLAVMAQTVWSW